MFAKVYSAGLAGIEGYPVSVETTILDGLPSFVLTGDLSRETHEGQIRVSCALQESGYEFLPQKISINLAPAAIHKDGTSYDLAIALSVISAENGCCGKDADDFAVFGELGLSGKCKPVRGILPLCFTARQSGHTAVIVPAENAAEAALVEGIDVYAVGSLTEAAEVYSGNARYREKFRYRKTEIEEETSSSGQGPDFSDVRGQDFLKRAAEIAVSGRHNILFSGPAGTGKTMIARRMPTILPDLTRDEDIEISKIYSICGLLSDGHPLLGKRPFRAPHHGITMAAFTGGGVNVLPGELSLASSGILFLDELPLFPRQVLETMREPMEERKITVSRLKGSYTYPADFQLVSAMNNCACGFYPDRKRCHCSPNQIRAYNGRLSKPLLERIDICAEARPIPYDQLIHREKPDEKPAETSAVIRERVQKVHRIQQERFQNEPSIRFNSRMGVREIEQYCSLGKAEASYMKEMFQKKSLSGRTYHKILKVARTIADMSGSPTIEMEHLSEALELRSIEDVLFARA